jgi:hypothetical protein
LLADTFLLTLTDSFADLLAVLFDWTKMVAFLVTFLASTLVVFLDTFLVAFLVMLTVLLELTFLDELAELFF